MRDESVELVVADAWSDCVDVVELVVVVEVPSDWVDVAFASVVPVALVPLAFVDVVALVPSIVIVPMPEVLLSNFCVSPFLVTVTAAVSLTWIVNLLVTVKDWLHGPVICSATTLLPSLLVDHVLCVSAPLR